MSRTRTLSEQDLGFEDDENQSSEKFESGANSTVYNAITASSGNTEYNVVIPKCVCSTDETTKLLAMFPEEIWLLIIGKLKDTESVATVFNASLYFRNLLHPQRVSFLFPHVWKVLGMQYERNLHPVYKEDTENENLKQFRLATGNTKQFRSFFVVAKLRQVCRIWCEGINKFYRNLDQNAKLKHDAPHPSKGICKWAICLNGHEQDGCWARRYELWEYATLPKFLSFFNATHNKTSKRSPFVSNKVLIKVGIPHGMGAARIRRYNENLTAFLEKYSEHIWHCEMHLDRGNVSETYLRFRSVLKQLPNLISLSIHFFATFDECELQVLRQLILGNRLPTMKKLRFLNCVKGVPVIMDELVKTNLHIEMLEIEQEAFEDYNLYSASLPNLSQLSVDICCKALFEKLYNVSWKLNKVYLNFTECPYVPWSKVFKLVENKWGKTATDVMLILPSAKSPDEIQQHINEHDSLKLNLAKCKRLRIGLGNFASMDFILPMQESLKQLEIAKYPYVLRYINNEFIEFWKPAFSEFQKNVGKTCAIKYPGKYPDEDVNIWELFPKLKVVEYYKVNFFRTRYSETYTRAK